MLKTTMTQPSDAVLEAAERRRPGRVQQPTDDLVQMFREPSGVVRAVWDDLPPEEELHVVVSVIPNTPESRDNEKVALLRVAAVIAVIAALCIMFGK